MVGDLAESWSVSADKLTYTFKLRSGVKFHDGSPLTSEDVKASWDRIINPPQGVVSIRKAYYADVASVEAPDAATVVFKMKAPVAGVLEALASPYNCIYKAAKLKENPRYPETEILGSGGFTFVEHVKGSTWEGKRFDGYFRTGQAVSRRVQGVLREVQRCGAGNSRRSVRCRVSRPQSVREGPAPGAGQGQARRLRGHLGQQPDARLQHDAQAVRRYPRAPGADAWRSTAGRARRRSPRSPF